MRYPQNLFILALWSFLCQVDPVTKTKINFIFAKTAHDELEKVFDLKVGTDSCT